MTPFDSSRGGQHVAVTLVVISSLVSVGREIAVAAEIRGSRNGELKVAAEERHNRYMPIRLTQRSRAVLWLLVRLVVFAGVTYVAVESLLLKPSREKLFDGVEDTGLAVWFRVKGTSSETKNVSLFGKTVFESTLERRVMMRGTGHGTRQYAIWKPHTDGVFYPQMGAAWYSTSDSNSIIYKVIPPMEPGPWKFKVEHKIMRKFQVGPFSFEGKPRYVIYSSPVMTNTLNPPDPIPIRRYR
jgi:hypothetical protein